MTFPSWWPYPSVVIKKRSRGGISRAKRNAVYERDDHRCVSCGAEARLTIDHKKPRAKGGTNALWNLQTMCVSCNQRKADR